MDPNKALADLLDKARRVESTDPVEAALELAKGILELVEWLQRPEGFLPERWEFQPTKLMAEVAEAPCVTDEERSNGPRRVPDEDLVGDGRCLDCDRRNGHAAWCPRADSEGSHGA